MVTRTMTAVARSLTRASGARATKRIGVALALAASATALPAAADPIVANQWYTFGFGATGSALRSGAGFTLGTNPTSISAPNGPWTITLANAATLTVVDGFNSGDQFALTDFGAAIGNTSAGSEGGNCGSDITACLADATISKGSFALAAGAHSLGGTLLASPFSGGAGFFRITAAVPEPATWAMMLVGFGMMGAAMRYGRRNTRAAVAA